MTKKLTEIEAYKLEILGLEAEKLKKEIELENSRIECTRLSQALMQEKMKTLAVEASQRKTHQDTLRMKLEDVSSQREGAVSDIKDRLGIDGPLDINPDTLEVIDNDHEEV